MIQTWPVFLDILSIGLGLVTISSMVLALSTPSKLFKIGMWVVFLMALLATTWRVAANTTKEGIVAAVTFKQAMQSTDIPTVLYDENLHALTGNQAAADLYRVDYEELKEGFFTESDLDREINPKLHPQFKEAWLSDQQTRQAALRRGLLVDAATKYPLVLYDKPDRFWYITTRPLMMGNRRLWVTQFTHVDNASKPPGP